MPAVILVVPALIDLSTLLAALGELGIIVSAVMGKEVYQEKKAEHQKEVESAVNVLKGMGYKVEEFGDLKPGEKACLEGMDLMVKTNQGYVLGLRKTEKGAYEVLAKWPEIQPTKKETSKLAQEIQKQVKQRYAYEKVKKEVKKYGFALAEEEVLKDNTIKLVVRKWG